MEMDNLQRTKSFDAFYQNFCNTIATECGYNVINHNNSNNGNSGNNNNYTLSELQHTFSEACNNDILSNGFGESSSTTLVNLEDIKTNENVHVVPNMEGGEGEQEFVVGSVGSGANTTQPTQQPTQPTQQQSSSSNDGEETEDDNDDHHHHNNHHHNNDHEDESENDSENDSEDSGEHERDEEEEEEEEDEEDPAYAPHNRKTAAKKAIVKGRGKKRSASMSSQTHSPSAASTSNASASKKRKIGRSQPQPQQQQQLLPLPQPQPQPQPLHYTMSPSPSLNNGSETHPCQLANGKIVYIPDDKMDLKWKTFCTYFTKQFKDTCPADLETVRDVRRRYQLRKSSQRGRTQQRERREQLETQLASIVTYTSDHIISALAPIVNRHVPQTRAKQLITDLNVAIRELLTAGATEPSTPPPPSTSSNVFMQ